MVKPLRKKFLDQFNYFSKTDTTNNCLLFNSHGFNVGFYITKTDYNFNEVTYSTFPMGNYSRTVNFLNSEYGGYLQYGTIYETTYNKLFSTRILGFYIIRLNDQLAPVYKLINQNNTFNSPVYLDNLFENKKDHFFSYYWKTKHCFYSK